jgi:hypothetical protein
VETSHKALERLALIETLRFHSWRWKGFNPLLQILNLHGNGGVYRMSNMLPEGIWNKIDLTCRPGYTFVRNDTGFTGSKYKKVRYVRYTDASFSTWSTWASWGPSSLGRWGTPSAWPSRTRPLHATSPSTPRWEARVSQPYVLQSLLVKTGLLTCLEPIIVKTVLALQS